jgi:hypothetical protein
MTTGHDVECGAQHYALRKAHCRVCNLPQVCAAQCSSLRDAQASGMLCTQIAEMARGAKHGMSASYNANIHMGTPTTHM